MDPYYYAVDVSSLPMVKPRPWKYFHTEAEAVHYSTRMAQIYKRPFNVVKAARAEGMAGHAPL